ncbi:hypothetical protein AC625_14315 [Peribacillus loiseleuriae]|uniref:Uncharacterized protein n=1 Tax=Peribacillus loiseleuriae TaxID=1679170 RepID=A0A0K9GV83_9BACI|nr:hypothetical protein AC625_14315 [Peribacillus loiseleuriae]
MFVHNTIICWALIHWVSFLFCKNNNKNGKNVLMKNKENVAIINGASLEKTTRGDTYEKA